MQELPVMVNLSREVGIVLLGRLEYHLRAIGELVSSKVDLAKAALANKPTQSVVADGLKVEGGELVEKGLV